MNDPHANADGRTSIFLIDQHGQTLVIEPTGPLSRTASLTLLDPDEDWA